MECDQDPKGTITPAQAVRPDSKSPGLQKLKGTRVEISFRGTWHLGFVMEMPDKSGRWGVQCDEDKAKILTYGASIRPVVGSELADKLHILPGGEVQVPGLSGMQEALDAQIKRHIAFLRNQAFLKETVVGHSVKFTPSWPATSPMYNKWLLSDKSAVQLQITEYVMLLRFFAFASHSRFITR